MRTKLTSAKANALFRFPAVLDKPLERFFIKIGLKHVDDESSSFIAPPSKPYVWRNDSDSFLKKYALTQKSIILPHLIAPIDEK